MSDPKFVEGEIVNVRSATDPEFNNDREVVEKTINGSTILDIVYLTPDGKEWFYTLYGQPNCVRVYKEESLRKIPPNEKTEWEDCVWSPEMIEQPIS